MIKLVFMILSLVFTVVIELIFAFPFLLSKKIIIKDFFEIIWANILTNPFVTFITYLSLQYFDFIIVNLIVIMLEIMVIFVEGYIFKKEFKNLKDYGYLFALYLNVLSFSFGFII
jgi:hypothetical protein